MRIAYVRVSTAEQNEQRQIDALAKHDMQTLPTIFLESDILLGVALYDIP